MSLSTILQGEVFTVRSYKQYVGFAWANNYEVEATQDISNPSTELEFLANRIVELEKNLHLAGITIDRVTISTYVPDSLPYNPNNVATFPFSVNFSNFGSLKSTETNPRRLRLSKGRIISAISAR